jgi:hypothetical protein
MFPLLSLCFFFKIFLSPKPLYFSTLKKNLCSSLFPTNNLLIPLLVRLYFPFFSLFFLFISTKKNILFFLFRSPFVFIRGRGRGSPYPAQAQGKVAGAWLTFLFHYGDRVKGIWVVLGGVREREKIEKSSSSLPLHVHGKKKMHTTIQNSIVPCF